MCGKKVGIWSNRSRIIIYGWVGEWESDVEKNGVLLVWERGEGIHVKKWVI